MQCERDSSHACCHQHWQRSGIWRVKERRGVAVLLTSSFALPSHRSISLVIMLIMTMMDSEVENRSSLEELVNFEFLIYGIENLL